MDGDKLYKQSEVVARGEQEPGVWADKAYICCHMATNALAAALHSMELPLHASPPTHRGTTGTTGLHEACQHEYEREQGGNSLRAALGAACHLALHLLQLLQHLKKLRTGETQNRLQHYRSSPSGERFRV
jgi:hypothetical protein